MTAKHADPVYRANARIRRQQVDRARRFGDEVACRRCGRPIEDGQRYDIGHIDEHGGHSLANLAPEHVSCNRRHGGRLGSAITNRARGARTNARRLRW